MDCPYPYSLYPYLQVFGESVLNDAVSIVLTRSIIEIGIKHELTTHLLYGVRPSRHRPRTTHRKHCKHCFSMIASDAWPCLSSLAAALPLTMMADSGGILLSLRWLCLLWRDVWFCWRLADKALDLAPQPQSRVFAALHPGLPVRTCLMSLRPVSGPLSVSAADPMSWRKP